MEHPSPATILVVDDESLNRILLKTYLEELGHTVIAAENGRDALTIANEQPIDAILLDLIMPQPDGLEVLRQLKENPNTHTIPVVVVSASEDLVSAARCIELGALDYLTKPYAPEILKARINASLANRQYQRMQREYMRTLEERNEELDAFAQTVAHDLKSPISHIIGFADLIRTSHQEMLVAELEEYLGTIYDSAHNATKLIDDLLLLARIRYEEVMIEEVQMRPIVADVLAELTPLIVEKEARVELPKQWLNVMGQPVWIQEIWRNYLSNGLKYGGATPTLSLGSVKDANRQIKMWVQDNGSGIPQDRQDELFRPFTQLDNGNVAGHGLGLSIVRRLVDKMHGEVGVVSREGYGSQFWFTLPAASE